MALSNAERQERSRLKRSREGLCSVPGCPEKVEGQSRCERHRTEFNENQLRPQRLRRKEGRRAADEKTRLVTNTLAAISTETGMVTLIENAWLIDVIRHSEAYFDRWSSLLRVFAPSLLSLLPPKPELPHWSDYFREHAEALIIYFQGVPLLEENGHEPGWGGLADVTKDIEVRFAIDNRRLKQAFWEICEANDTLFALVKENEDALPFRPPSPKPYEDPPAVSKVWEEAELLLEARSAKRT